MKHLGDITKITNAPAVDCIIGGSPCQDLSQAGLRKGLSGARSGLFMEQVRIIKEMRRESERSLRTNINVRPCRFAVWENVPGAFSSNKSEDFRAVLEEFCRICDSTVSIPRPAKGKWQPAGCILGDGWSLAWRTHDAQYWGVPQRRRRISVLLDMDGWLAPEILFQERGGEAERAYQDELVAGAGTRCQQEVLAFRESLSRHYQQSNAQRQGAASSAGSGPAQHDTDGAVICCIEGNGQRDSHRGDGYAVTDTMYTLNTVEHHAVAYNIGSYASNSMMSANPQSGIQEIDTVRTLDMNGGNPACNQGGTMIVYDARGNGDGATVPTITGDHENRVTDYTALAVECKEYGFYPQMKAECITWTEDVSCTLVNGTNPGFQNGVCYGIDHAITTIGNCTAGGSCVYEDICPTLKVAGVHAVAYRKTAHPRNADEPQGWEVAETADTLNCTDNSEARTPTLAVAIGNGQADQTGLHEVVGALNCMHDQQAVMVYGIGRDAFNMGANAKFGMTIEENLAPPCIAKGPGAVAAVDCRNCKESQINGTLQAKESGGTSLNLNNVCRENLIVRRLTPLECERLQGFPDGWTDIGEWTDSKGKKHPCSDSKRYQALGNSIALPFWRWLIDRISLVYDGKCHPTMASLFAGIGGFDYLWEQRNGNGSVVWNSEIEEFQSAVLRKRFGDG